MLLLAPLRAFGTPVLDAIQPTPFPAMQALFGPSFPDGNQNHWKSSLQRDLSDGVIVTVVEHANRMTSPPSAVVLEYYGGVAGRIAQDATAFPHRNLPWDNLAIAQWTEPAQSTSHRDWARALEDTLRPFSGGHLLSALDVESDDVIQTAFGPNLPRLAAIKKKYIPRISFESIRTSNPPDQLRRHLVRGELQFTTFPAK